MKYGCMKILKISNLYFSSTGTINNLTSSAAAQMIKQLYINDGDKMYDKYDSYKHKEIVKKAFEIYHNVNGSNLNHLVINSLVKLCVHFELTSFVFTIWKDIETECLKHKNSGTANIGYPLLIKCCIKSKKFDKGKHIHHILQSVESTKKDLKIQNSLIDMYGYFGDEENALNIFDGIADSVKTDVTIGAMMRAFMKCCKYKEAMQIYNKYESLLTNDIYIKGMLIHYYQNDVFNALEIFQSIDNNKMDIVCVGAMLQVYCNANMNTECIHLFANMQSINNKLRADILCFIVVLRCCAKATALQFGHKIHNQLLNNIGGNKWMLSELRIQISLILLYGKCGMMGKCEEIFCEIEMNENEKYRKEEWLWLCMIKSYGRNGDIIKAKETFNKMKYEYNIACSAYTYLSLIHCCSHSGHLCDANDIWNNEIVDENVKYDKYVVTAMVDTLSRKGELRKAKELIDKYESYSNNNYHQSMWMSLLSACKKYKDLIFAQQIHREIIKRFPKNERYLVSSSVLLSNLHSSFGEYEKSENIWNEMKRKGWKKEPAISQIDIYGKIHQFYAGYEYRKIREYRIIDRHLQQLAVALQTNYNFQHDLSLITRQLNDNETAQDRLLRHGEKLALLYGLLTTPNHYLLVINKNLRICADCHSFIKLTSLMKNRKIIVSDLNRVHVFNNGQCSCNDYY